MEVTFDDRSFEVGQVQQLASRMRMTMLAETLNLNLNRSVLFWSSEWRDQNKLLSARHGQALFYETHSVPVLQPDTKRKTYFNVHK